MTQLRASTKVLNLLPIYTYFLHAQNFYKSKGCETKFPHTWYFMNTKNTWKSMWLWLVPIQIHQSMCHITTTVYAPIYPIVDFLYLLRNTIYTLLEQWLQYIPMGDGISLRVWSPIVIIMLPIQRNKKEPPLLVQKEPKMVNINYNSNFTF